MHPPPVSGQPTSATGQAGQASPGGGSKPRGASHAKQQPTETAPRAVESESAEVVEQLADAIMELQAQQQHTEAARLAADSVLAAARQEIASLERQLHSALSRAAALDDAVTDGGLLSDIQAKEGSAKQQELAQLEALLARLEAQLATVERQLEEKEACVDGLISNLKGMGVAPPDPQAEEQQGLQQQPQGPQSGVQQAAAGAGSGSGTGGRASWFAGASTGLLSLKKQLASIRQTSR